MDSLTVSSAAPVAISKTCLASWTGSRGRLATKRVCHSLVAILKLRHYRTAARWSRRRIQYIVLGHDPDPSRWMSEATRGHHRHGSGEPQRRGQRCVFGCNSPGAKRHSTDHPFRSVGNSGTDRGRGPGLRRVGLGGKAGAKTCVPGSAAGPGGCDRGLANRWHRRRFPAPRTEAPLRRDSGIGRRVPGIHRRAVQVIFSRTIQADEFVLRAHRSDGYVVERTECALRVARAQSCGDNRLHFID